MPSDRSPEADVTLFSGGLNPSPLRAFAAPLPAGLGASGPRESGPREFLGLLDLQVRQILRPLVCFSYLYLFLRVTTEAA